jgi:hypothetical protein
MRQTGNIAPIRLLRGIFYPRTSTFQHKNSFSLPNQLYGQDNSSSPCADDADVGGLHCGFGQALHQVVNQI